MLKKNANVRFWRNDNSTKIIPKQFPDQKEHSENQFFNLVLFFEINIPITGTEKTWINNDLSSRNITLICKMVEFRIKIWSMPSITVKFDFNLDDISTSVMRQFCFLPPNDFCYTKNETFSITSENELQYMAIYYV